MQISKTVRLKIAKWYAKNLLQIEPGYNVHLEKWNVENNECTATITCFTDYPDPRYRKSKEDLEEYIVKKFGSMIIKDLSKPRDITLGLAAINLPISHPLIKRDKVNHPSLADSYNRDYILDMTRDELTQANQALKDMGIQERFQPESIKKNSSYTPDIRRLRIGQWSEQPN